MVVGQYFRKMQPIAARSHRQFEWILLHSLQDAHGSACVHDEIVPWLTVDASFVVCRNKDRYNNGDGAMCI
jgi:hypothetical protein